MRIFFDAEFIEDGRTIDLLSIGMVRLDGETFYAENIHCDRSRAGPWVVANVLPHLILERTDPRMMTRYQMAEGIRKFVGEQPEFWAYYADYDWVALCQIYGTMMQLPAGWPMFCRDIKQLCVDKGDPKLPPKMGREHNALDDAVWARAAWMFLMDFGKEKPDAP